MNDSLIVNAISVAEITRAEVQYHSRVRHTQRHARSRLSRAPTQHCRLQRWRGHGEKRGSPGLGGHGRRNEAVRDEMAGTGEDGGHTGRFWESMDRCLV